MNVKGVVAYCIVFSLFLMHKCLRLLNELKNYELWVSKILEDIIENVFKMIYELKSML